jgi:glutamyl-tRNA reductase
VTTAGSIVEAETALPAFDVVVACSGGDARVGCGTLHAASDRRTSTPLLVVDLAVPREVEPLARSLPGVLLYDVDDLAAAAQHALALRRTHVPAAEAIVEEELRGFGGWHATRALVPTIKALRAHQRRAVTEVLGDLPEDLVERLVTRLLHGPTARLRKAAKAGAGELWAETARELFDLHADGALTADLQRLRRAAGAGR